MSGKRKRLEWARLDTQKVCNKVLEPGVNVLFVDATQRKYQRAFDTDPNLVSAIRIEPFVHDPSKVHSDGTSMSVCAQYILWLDRMLRVDAVPSKYSEIELWMYDDVLFLFRRRDPGFFYKQPSNFEALVRKKEYQAETCLQSGFNRSTSMALLALYYLKFLPAEQRAWVYLHPSYILTPPLGGVYDEAFEKKEQAFSAAFADFIARTGSRVGVAWVSIDEKHAQTIVYDAPNKRLEIYNSASNGPLEISNMDETLYGYLAAKGPLLLEQLGICRLYGNGLEVQGRMRDDVYGKRPDQAEDRSCALWATVFAICRMTGVDRDRLPILFQDVLDISTMLRDVMLRTCGLDKLQDNLWTQQVFDSLLEDCTPDPSDVRAILALVTKHQEKTPILIPPDRELCEEEKKDEPPCTTIYLNLNEIKLTYQVVFYLRTLCPNATWIDLQIPNDNSIDYEQIRFLYLFDKKPVTLNFISPAGSTLDLDDVVVSFVVHTMLNYSKNITVHTQQATVTTGFVNEKIRNSPIWRKLRVDRILLTSPTSAQTYKTAANALRNISQNVFGVIERDSDLEWAKTSGLNQFVFRLQEFVLPDTFEGFPAGTTFVTKW